MGTISTLVVSFPHMGRLGYLFHWDPSSIVALTSPYEESLHIPCIHLNQVLTFYQAQSYKTQ